MPFMLKYVTTALLFYFKASVLDQLDQHEGNEPANEEKLIS